MKAELIAKNIKRLESMVERKQKDIVEHNEEIEYWKKELTKTK